MRNFLRAHLAGNASHAGGSRRLDLHTLLQKGSLLKMTTMHVLVEPINVPEAAEWVSTAMKAAYGGELLYTRHEPVLTGLEGSSR